MIKRDNLSSKWAEDLVYTMENIIEGNHALLGSIYATLVDNVDNQAFLLVNVWVTTNQTDLEK